MKNQILLLPLNFKNIFQPKTSKSKSNKLANNDKVLFVGITLIVISNIFPSPYEVQISTVGKVFSSPKLQIISVSLKDTMLLLSVGVTNS